MLTLLLILLLACTAAFGQASVRPGEEVSFDATHHLSFEFVPEQRRADANGTPRTVVVRFVRLHAIDGDKKTDVALVDHAFDNNKADSRYSLIQGPMITQMRYRDKDTAWIVSYGHSTSHALLVDLAGKKVVPPQYYGVGFVLSPDAKALAFCWPYGQAVLGRPLIQRSIVFVNDTMVYPVVEGGFTVWDLMARTNEEEIRKPDGTTFAECLEKAAFRPGEMGSSWIVWRSPDTIAFTVMENVDDTTETQIRSVACVVTGLSANGGAPDPAKIRLTRTIVPVP
jgi:hypothetical protein